MSYGREPLVFVCAGFNSYCVHVYSGLDLPANQLSSHFTCIIDNRFDCLCLHGSCGRLTDCFYGTSSFCTPCTVKFC